LGFHFLVHVLVPTVRFPDACVPRTIRNVSFTHA